MNTCLERVAEMLSWGDWVSGNELKLISHRFGHYILCLRRGDHDGRFWIIEKERRSKGEWKYRQLGFSGECNVDHPTCLDCGSTNIRMRDDRS
jgi:hypothetical protein